MLSPNLPLPIPTKAILHFHLDFIQKLIKVTPYEIRGIQTDNGSEFLNYFDQIITKQGIVHFFTYLRYPKQNGVIERFNRTIQDEFVESSRELLEKMIPVSSTISLLITSCFTTPKDHIVPYNQEPMKAVVDYLKKSNRYETDTPT